MAFPSHWPLSSRDQHKTFLSLGAGVCPRVSSPNPSLQAAAERGIPLWHCLEAVLGTCCAYALVLCGATSFFIASSQPDPPYTSMPALGSSISSSIPLSGLSDCLCGCSVLYPMPSLGALTTEIPGSRDICARALVSSDAWGRLLLVQIQDCKIDIHLLSPGCSSILEIVVGVAVVRIRSIGCAWGRSDGWSS